MADTAPGIVVVVRDVAYVVEKVTPTDERPEGARSWSTWVHAEMLRLPDRTPWQGLLPRHVHSFASQGVRLLSTDADHYPTCSTCLQPWPCVEDRHRRYAERRTDALLEQIEHEAEHPWPCSWCARFTPRYERRFRTERGLKQHIRRCGSNPATWDPDTWILMFDDDLRIEGGFAPEHRGAGLLLHGDAERHEHVNRALIADVAAGVPVPATLDELVARHGITKPRPLWGGLT